MAATRDPMLGFLLRTPQDIDEHWRRGCETPGWRLDEWPSGIAVLGMGGSGMAGQLLASLLDGISPVPVVPVTDTRLPEWVRGGCLVLAASYSGDTWETLSLLEEARRRGLPWRAVASGGSLVDLARDAGVPCVHLDRDRPPRSVTVPACASLLALFRGLWPSLDGLVAGTSRGVREDLRAWRLDERAGAAASVDSNRPWPVLPRDPRVVARVLASRLPLLYGWGTLGEAVVYRWACQLSENAKLAAHTHRLPELLHNEIVGWASWGRVAPRPVVIHVLAEQRAASPDASPPEESPLWDRVWSELSRAGLEAFRVPAAGASPLESAVRQIVLGDAVSVILARETGVKATPVDPIQRLKGD